MLSWQVKLVIAESRKKHRKYASVRQTANICFEFPVLLPPFLVQSVVLPSHFQVAEKSPASILHLSDLQFESSNLNSHLLICVPSCFITLKYDFEAIF